MIKGTTKSGFNYTIQEGALDDYELLEELREHKSDSRRNRKDHRLRTKRAVKKTCKRRNGKSIDKTNG